MVIMRLFIAANINNKETRNGLLSLQSKINLKGVKLVKEAQFHFTFHFLGDIDSNEVPEIQNIIDNISLNSFDPDFVQTTRSVLSAPTFTMTVACVSERTRSGRSYRRKLYKAIGAICT